MLGEGEVLKEEKFSKVDAYAAQSGGDAWKGNICLIPCGGSSRLEEYACDLVSGKKMLWLGLSGEYADEDDKGDEDAERNNILGDARLSPQSMFCVRCGILEG